MRKALIILKTLFGVTVAISLFGAATLFISRFDMYLPIVLPRWVSIGGVVLIIAGCILAISCLALFSAKGALTPGPQFPDPSVLIATGPYQYVRNPMSKGLFTTLAGWGVYQRSPSIMLFAMAIAVFMHLFIVFVEEPKLERRFGQSYLDYKRKVNRWLPAGRLLR